MARITTTADPIPNAPAWRVWLSVAVVAALCAAAALGGFDPTSGPAPDGSVPTCDLPAGRHIKNVGGSDGAGLCVFTSVQHSADWQGVRDLDGFREWMRRRPGGGWPQKLDQMLAQFAREKGVQLPAYIQHTGGDESFLELALKTDRMPCVTYAGRDDFYRTRVAHMVNLAHLDEKRAAIIDNNRPGVWLWMTRSEFLYRWRDMDGGWAVVLLAPPPPPHPEKVQAFGAAPPACVCGDACDCEAKGRKCPGGCTVVGQCADGRCPLPLIPANSPLIPAGPSPVGNPPTDRHEWGFIPGAGWGWKFKELPKEARFDPVPPPREVDIENFGVDTSKIHASPAYSVNGVGVGKDVAMSLLAGGNPLVDDSGNWHLTAVGDAAFLARVRADVAALAPDLRAKLHFQAFGPGDWPVSAFALPSGVNLRRPSPGRTSGDVGTVAAGDYSAAKLASLLSSPGGPVVGPAKPDEPKPHTPAKPDEPLIPPAPASGNTLLGWIAAAVAFLILVFRSKK